MLETLYREIKSEGLLKDREDARPPYSRPRENALAALVCEELTDHADRKLLIALHYVCRVVARYARDGSIYIAQLDEEEARLEAAVKPFYVPSGLPGHPGLSGFYFVEDDEEAILEIFSSSQRLASGLLKRIAINMRNGIAIPSGAQRLAQRVLWGDLKVPGPDNGRGDELHRDTLLVGLAKRLREEAGFPVGWSTWFRSNSHIPIAGVTLAAAALGAFGVTVNSQRARKIANDKGTRLIAAVPDVEELLRPVVWTSQLPGASLATTFEEHMQAYDPEPKVYVALRYFWP
jgi:hypothetical protein